MSLQLKVTALNDDADCVRTGSALRTAATIDVDGTTDFQQRLSPLLNGEAQRVVALSAAAAAAAANRGSSASAEDVIDDPVIAALVSAAKAMDAAENPPKAAAPPSNEPEQPKQLVFRVFGRAAGRSFPPMQVGEFACPSGEASPTSAVSKDLGECVVRQHQQHHQNEPSTATADDEADSAPQVLYVAVSLSGAAQAQAFIATTLSGFAAELAAKASGRPQPNAQPHWRHLPFTPLEVEEVMSATGCAHARAVKYLQKHRGNVSDAIDDVALSMLFGDSDDEE
jgi:hypothetical protein